MSSLPNPNWDTRRLWLNQYTEINREVRITASARDGEDVSEFLRRLSVSEFFSDVKPLPAKKNIDTVTHLELLSFQVSAKARY